MESRPCVTCMSRDTHELALIKAGCFSSMLHACWLHVCHQWFVFRRSLLRHGAFITHKTRDYPSQVVQSSLHRNILVLQPALETPLSEPQVSPVPARQFWKPSSQRAGSGIQGDPFLTKAPQVQRKLHDRCSSVYAADEKMPVYGGRKNKDATSG